MERKNHHNYNNGNSNSNGYFYCYGDFAPMEKKNHIQHPVSKLDTLAGIAIKYGVDVNFLFSFLFSFLSFFFFWVYNSCKNVTIWDAFRLLYMDFIKIATSLFMHLRILMILTELKQSLYILGCC